ncbi:MAG TPA: bifunctional homocysteine S-methyltransferase/methylenetetrahydrofolate reductase [Thermomicrobiales bacterium]|nr:bifunctional homocysteine S-methyltransferase/methylenetetrahydrofolate reductase [Thermomicrobiales bacterium]
MAHPVLERLAAGPLLCDGAMGTLLYARGVPLDDCFDALNLARPELVQDVHLAYIHAGADVIETNTFGANRFKLEAFGLEDQVRAINLRGVNVAREAERLAGREVFIAGSVGPTGRTLAPLGTTDPADVRAAFREQIGALLERGVDLLIVETMPALAEVEEALAAAREAGADVPIVVQLTFADDGRTPLGHAAADVVARLRGAGLAALGANCSTGPRDVLTIARAMLADLDGAGAPPYVAGQPNAGWPQNVNGRVLYPSSPEYFAGFARELAEAGGRLIGGCCGTTPEHTRAMRAALDGWRRERTDAPRVVAVGAPATAVEVAPERRERAVQPPDGPTELARKLGRKFIVSVELDPPRGLNPTKLLKGARMLKDLGVDAINVADSPMARVRMSALAICYLLQHTVGVETIIHFTTRDRNLMGLQSDLLGAHAAGVRNILALTGDPPNLGTYPGATAVYDVDSIGLIRILSALNAGADSAGNALGKRASFTIACAADPTRADLDEEADRLHQKLAAGADFVMTQIVYDLDRWRRFVALYERRHGPLGVPVLLGILPLQSHKQAEFLHNEVPGIVLPDAVRERMRLAGPDGRREGVRMAQELLLEAREVVQGTYIMPSFDRYELAAEVLDALPRDE